MILRVLRLFLIVLYNLMVEKVGIVGLRIVNLDDLLLSLLGLAFRVNILANQIVGDINVLIIAALLEQVESARRLHLDYARVATLKLWHLLHTVVLAAPCCFAAV